jgi:tetratricopeptide (TPR) repeat protein
LIKPDDVKRHIMKASRSFQRTINQCLQIFCGTLLIVQPGAHAQAPSITCKSRSDTIAHKLLRLESTTTTVTPTMYELLDRIIEEASNKIRAKHKEATTITATPDDARLIDDVLTAHNFVYPGEGLVAHLSDTLRDANISRTELDALEMQPHNARRLSHIKAHASEPFHLADCDTASVIYLAVLENLRLDCSLIEAPGHTFIRCYENGKPAFNFETMDGSIILDSFYTQNWHIPKELVQNGVYLSRLSSDEVLGIGHFLLGQEFYSRSQYARAIAEYEMAGIMHGRSPAVWNDLGWLYATARDARFRDGQKALEYASRALAIYRSPESLDTMACAYAESGLFDKAVELEKEACTASHNPEYAKALNAYRDHKTWLQIHLTANPNKMAPSTK